MDLDAFAAKHGLKPGARYRRFIEKDEGKKYAGRAISGLPNWSASSKLNVRFLKPSFELFEEHGLEPEDHPNLVPLAAVSREPDFFAVDVASANARVHYFDHEEGAFLEVAPSLDVFLGRLLKKGEKTPFERVRAALKSAAATYKKNDGAKLLGTLGELPEEWAGGMVPEDANELIAEFLNYQGIALKELKRHAAAKKAFEGAVKAGASAARLNLMAMYLADGNPKGAIELGKDAVFMEDEEVFWVMRYLVEAYLATGELGEAEGELRALHRKFAVEDEARLGEVRTWLTSLAAKNDAAGKAAKGFLEWFVPVRASAATAGALRQWWDGLPAFGSFWQPYFLGELKLKKAPTDDQLARILRLRHINIEHDGPIDVTPLARLEGLEHVSLKGDVLSLEPLRSLSPELSVQVNNETIRGLRMRPRADVALLAAAKVGDDAAMRKALDEGANPNAKTPQVMSVLHLVLQNFSLPEAKKVKQAITLIERGADLYVDNGNGKTPLEHCSPKAVRALEAAYAKTGREAAESPFRVWEEPDLDARGDVAYLKAESKDEVLSDLPRGKLVAKIDSKRNTRLVDFHSVFNYSLVGITLVSPRVRDFLVREGMAEGVSFHPVSVLSEAGKPVAAELVLLWPSEYECLDEAKSEPRYRSSYVDEKSPPDDTNFSDVARIVIDAAKVPKQVTLFRAKHFTQPLLVRAEAAERLAAQGFEGGLLNLPRR